MQLWKTPTTGELSFQVHGCCAAEILIDPPPADTAREGALYPDGAHLKDLEEVRELLYKMQRPAIAPQVRLFSFLKTHSPLPSFPTLSLSTHTTGTSHPLAHTHHI
jgi:hypothetical protein